MGKRDLGGWQTTVHLEKDHVIKTPRTYKELRKRSYPHLKEREVFSEKFVDPNFFPDWDAIEPLRYRYQLNGKRCINIMTRRGNCPFHCTFCARQEVGRSSLRFRSVENVLREVAFLKDEFGFGAVAIYDDDVFVNTCTDVGVGIRPVARLLQRFEFRDHQAAGKPGRAGVFAVDCGMWPCQYQAAFITQLFQASDVIRPRCQPLLQRTGGILTDKGI